MKSPARIPRAIDRGRERSDMSGVRTIGRGRTLQQVGNVYGLTRERIRTIERDALAHLRYWMEGLASGELTREDLERARRHQREHPGTRTWAVVRREAAEKAAGGIGSGQSPVGSRAGARKERAA